MGSNKSYRSEALQAAKDLGYPPEVITRIEEAKNENDISRIMLSARQRKEYHDDGRKKLRSMRSFRN